MALAASRTLRPDAARRIIRAVSGATTSLISVLDRLDRMRTFAVSTLVCAAAFALVVPITMGLFQDPSADISDGWCGTWVLRFDHPDCPTCCAQFGAYRLRGAIVGVLLVVAAMSWSAVAIAVEA